jgi:uncharacterized protein YyaL (SSP411 family)
VNDTTDDRPANRLARETSAYLRQHMHNPVDWYPWGREALDRAQREDKPLLLSIGYSACHWCHVMEHESFEDPETAALMNRLFVNIKVDREERPDVDQIYMDTITRLTGHGGWPLTVFCTPEGEPFYGGTYFPPVPRHGLPSFRQLLEGIAEAYRVRRDEVGESAAQILASLRQRPEGQASETPGAETVARAAAHLLQRADPEHGGFGGAPKFPTPTSLDLLLAAVDVLPERKAREALDQVALTCREMARGGLYDHLGGGFHRYCVDALWRIPHFEKMLYDQGLLLRVYTELSRRTGNRDDDLLWPIRETVEFLRREMTAPEGGFHASFDADSEGEEGRFYVWNSDQVAAELGSEAGPAFCQAYGITARGNFEGGTTVLHDVSREPRARFREEREALHGTRGKRIPPGLDSKRVASWNGFTISGLARAGSLLDDASMIRDAATAADFVLERMTDAAGRPCRVFDAGRASVPAFLDDLAAMLEASLDLWRAGVGDRFGAAALRIADDIAARFYDDAEGDLFFTPSDGEPLVHRPRRRHAALGRPRGAGAAAHRDAGRASGPATDRRARDRNPRRRAGTGSGGLLHPGARRSRSRAGPLGRRRRRGSRVLRHARPRRSRPARAAPGGGRPGRVARRRPARRRRPGLAPQPRRRRRSRHGVGLPRYRMLTARGRARGADAPLAVVP